jgi:hypothetical protein
MASWKHLWIAAVVACSSGSKSPKPPAGGGDSAGDSSSGDSSSGSCEPGRCLEDISKKIQERKSEARACYDALSTKKVTGRLIINFRIDAEGSVTETSQGMQEGQIEDETLITCVSDVIKSVKFAKSSAGKNTRAYHLFEFAPR